MAYKKRIFSLLLALVLVLAKAYTLQIIFRLPG